MANNELIFKFKGDNSQLKNSIKETQNAVSGIIDKVKNLTKAYIGLQVIRATIIDMANFNTQLNNQINLIGGNVQNITAMGNALKRFGGDTNSITGALKSMQAQMQQLKFGGGALIEISKKYGVTLSAYGSAENNLKSLIKQTQNMSRETKLAIAQQLGFDEAMQNALINGKEFEKLINQQKKFGVATKEDLKISSKFTNALLDIKDAFNSIVREISRVLLPIFTKFANLMTKFILFMKEHKTLLIAIFGALFLAMLPILGILAKMAIASALAFAPFIAIASVITAIAVILEDIYYYFKGYDSVTGQLVKKIPFIGKALEYLRPVFMAVEKLFKSIMVFLENPSWANFVNILKNIVNIIGSAILSTIKAVGQALLELFLLPIQWIKEKLQLLAKEFPIIEFALKPIIALMDLFSNAIKYVQDKISKLSFEGLKNSIKIGIDNVKQFGEKIYETITAYFSKAMDKVKSIGNSIMDFFGLGDDEKEINQTKQIQQQVEAIKKVPDRPIIPAIPTNAYNNNAYNNNTTNNNTTINNNINQNIATSNPQVLANQTSAILQQDLKTQINMVGAK